MTDTKEKDKLDTIIDKINQLEIRIARIEEKLSYQSTTSKIYYTIITILIASMSFLVGFFKWFS